MPSNENDPLDRIYEAMLDSRGEVPRPEFPGYRLGEAVGAGGFGIVYKAFDETLQRTCAVKLLLENRAADPASRAAFLHEARALARVRHPNVLAVYGVLEHAGTQALCTEFIEGPALSERVAEGPLSPGEVVRVGIDLCGALDAVHAAGIVHRDVKTSNVLCDRGGRTVLADFGLGVFLSPDRANTCTQGAAGSPLFMSPEQLSGTHVDARGDIYSLGVVLYNMSTTGFPHTAEDVATLIDRVADEAPVPVTTLMPDFPPALSAVIMRAMEKDPDRRYQTAAAMGEALEDCVRRAEGRGDAAAAQPGAAPRRRFVATTAALLLLAAAAAWLALPDRAPGFHVQAGARVHSADGRVRPTERARAGERVSLEFSADRDVCLYAIQEDRKGKKFLLFPASAGGAGSRVRAGEKKSLPETSAAGWTSREEDVPGWIVVIASSDPIGPLEDALPADPPSADPSGDDRLRLKPVSVRGLRRVLQERTGLDAGAEDDGDAKWILATLVAELGSQGEEGTAAERGVWMRALPLFPGAGSR